MPLIEEVPEFSKDKQKLRFGTLDEDLGVFKKALGPQRLKIRGAASGEIPGAKRISGLGSSVTVPIFKARHFRCKALRKGSRSGIRVIYAYEKGKDKYTLIEIYYKGDKENEDRARILKYFGQRRP